MEKGDNRIRAFVSIKFPKEIADKLIAAVNELDRSWARPVDSSVHLTLLFFLDGIKPDDIDKVVRCIDALRAGPFKMTVRGTGALPSSSPRVVFAEIEKNETLTEIYENLKTMLEGIGMRFDQREFFPHATIARIGRPNTKDLGKFLSKYNDFDFGSFTCNEIFLMKSVLTSNGPVHTEIHVKKLINI